MFCSKMCVQYFRNKRLAKEKRSWAGLMVSILNSLESCIGSQSLVFHWKRGWCEGNHLCLNSKTKEMRIDFSKKTLPHSLMNILGEDTEYLGIRLNNKLD